MGKNLQFCICEKLCVYAQKCKKVTTIKLVIFKTFLNRFDLVYKGCNEYIYIIISNTFLYIYNIPTKDVNQLVTIKQDVNHWGV